MLLSQKSSTLLKEKTMSYTKQSYTEPAEPPKPLS